MTERMNVLGGCEVGTNLKHIGTNLKHEATYRIFRSCLLVRISAGSSPHLSAALVRRKSVVGLWVIGDRGK